jgi:hypothetical protein
LFLLLSTAAAAAAAAATIKDIDVLKSLFA